MDGLVGDLIELIGLFLDEGSGPEKEARSIGDTFPEFLLLMRDEGFSVGTGCEQRAKAQIPVCCLSGRTLGLFCL